MNKAEKERQRQAARRAAGDEAWGAMDARTAQRITMKIAALILDEAGEQELADWLLLARPERARAVATGVAVHALRRYVCAAWDVLAAGDALVLEQAAEDFDACTTFIWQPDPGDLL